MEPLNPAIQARLQEYRSRPKPISTLGPKISPPVAKAPKVAPTPRGQLGDIVAAVCEAWMITPGDLLSIWRPHRVSYPRFAAMKLMRKLTGASYPQLGKMFGKDHSSIVHALKRCNELLKEDSAWRACYLRALAALESRSLAGRANVSHFVDPKGPAGGRDTQTQAVGRPGGGDTDTASGQRQGQLPAKPVSAGIPASPVAAGSAPDASLPRIGIGRNNSRGAA